MLQLTMVHQAKEEKNIGLATRKHTVNQGFGYQRRKNRKHSHDNRQQNQGDELSFVRPHKNENLGQIAES